VPRSLPRALPRPTNTTKLTAYTEFRTLPQRSHRSHARDGPRRAADARPQPTFWHPRSGRRVAPASGRTSSTSSRSASKALHRTVSAQRIDHHHSRQPEPSFFTPQASPPSSTSSSRSTSRSLSSRLTPAPVVEGLLSMCQFPLAAVAKELPAEASAGTQRRHNTLPKGTEVESQPFFGMTSRGHA
jgi:hypothetical protein